MPFLGAQNSKYTSLKIRLRIQCTPHSKNPGLAMPMIHLKPASNLGSAVISFSQGRRKGL